MSCGWSWHYGMKILVADPICNTSLGGTTKSSYSIAHYIQGTVRDAMFNFRF